VKRELGFEGIKGMGEGKVGAFFWLRLRAIAEREETD
jgi:hypothetical protein